VPPFKLYIFTTILAIFLLSMVDTGMFKVNLTKGTSPPPSTEAAREGNSQPSKQADAEPGTPTETPAKLSETKPTEGEQATEEAGDSFLRRIGTRFREGMRRGQKDPQKVNRLMVRTIPKAMFLLLPFFALLWRVLYLKHRFNYPHWFIFSLHFHTFGFFLLMVAGALLWLDLRLLVRVLVLTVPPIYLFLSLKRLTGERWWRTLIKLFFFNMIYLVAISVAMVLIATWTLINF